MSDISELVEKRKKLFEAPLVPDLPPLDKILDSKKTSTKSSAHGN
jgi:hypothetical protein